jgi:hypothetical protein
VETSNEALLAIGVDASGEEWVMALTPEELPRR